MYGPPVGLRGLVRPPRGLEALCPPLVQLEHFGLGVAGGEGEVDVGQRRVEEAHLLQGRRSLDVSFIQFVFLGVDVSKIK